MDKFGMKAAFAVTTAAALLAAQPAQAAMGCWDEQPAAAAKVRDLQSRLMVATLRCQAMGQGMGADVTAAYNDFVRQNRTTLQGANGLIKAQFDTGYGKEGATYYDRFATSLANKYGGDATSAEICSDTLAAAREAAAAAGDIGKLLALEDRFGPAPELPGGACARAPATLAAAEPQASPKAFGAAMGEALTAVSDAPAESDAPPPRADGQRFGGEPPVPATQPN